MGERGRIDVLVGARIEIGICARVNFPAHQRVELAEPDVDSSLGQKVRDVDLQIELGQINADAIYLPEALRAVDPNSRARVEAREVAEQPVRDEEWGIMT